MFLSIKNISEQLTFISKNLSKSKKLWLVADVQEAKPQNKTQRKMSDSSWGVETISILLKTFLNFTISWQQNFYEEDQCTSVMWIKHSSSMKINI